MCTTQHDWDVLKRVRGIERIDNGHQTSKPIVHVYSHINALDTVSKQTTSSNLVSQTKALHTMTYCTTSCGVCSQNKPFNLQ